MTAKRRRAVSAADPGPIPAGFSVHEAALTPAPAPAPRAARRGWFDLVVLVAVYTTASLVVQLLLAAWYRLRDEDDE